MTTHIIKERLCRGEEHMTTHIIKTWVEDDGTVVQQHIPQSEIYKREWVELTENEIEKLFQSAAGADEGTVSRFAAALQARLKQKNGYAEEKNT